MGQIYAHKKKAVVQNPNFSPKNSNTISALPNSLLLAVQSGQSGNRHNPELENIMKSRLAALHHQIPSAENEADQLSSGITSGTPEQVKESMGERLGADFSSVRFHTGASVSQRADNMGARAWTQGSDVYFGEGGFHPTVAAHELVHTAQQGAVDSASVNVSAPMGGVQMWNPFRKLANLFCGCNSRSRKQKTTQTQQDILPKPHKSPRNIGLLQNKMSFFGDEPSSPTQQHNDIVKEDESPFLMSSENQMGLDKAGEDLPKQQRNAIDNNIFPKHRVPQKGILRSNPSTTGAKKIKLDHMVQKTIQGTLQNRSGPIYLLKDPENLKKINTIYKGNSGERGVNMLDIWNVAFSTGKRRWRPKELKGLQSEIIEPLVKRANQSTKHNSPIVNMPDKENQSITRLADILMDNIDSLQGICPKTADFWKVDSVICQSTSASMEILKNQFEQLVKINEKYVNCKGEEQCQAEIDNIKKEINANFCRQNDLKNNMERMKTDYIKNVGAKNAVALEKLLTAFPKMFDPKKTKKMQEYQKCFIESQKVEPHFLKNIVADRNNHLIAREQAPQVQQSNDTGNKDDNPLLLSKAHVKKKVGWKTTEARIIDMSRDTHNIKDKVFEEALETIDPEFFGKGYLDAMEPQSPYKPKNRKASQKLESASQKLKRKEEFLQKLADEQLKKEKGTGDSQKKEKLKAIVDSFIQGSREKSDSQKIRSASASQVVQKKAHSYIQGLGKEQSSKKRGESTGSTQSLQKPMEDILRKYGKNQPIKKRGENIGSAQTFQEEKANFKRKIGEGPKRNDTNDSENHPDRHIDTSGQLTDQVKGKPEQNTQKHKLDEVFSRLQQWEEQEENERGNDVLPREREKMLKFFLEQSGMVAPDKESGKSPSSSQNLRKKQQNKKRKKAPNFLLAPNPNDAFDPQNDGSDSQNEDKAK